MTPVYLFYIFKNNFLIKCYKNSSFEIWKLCTYISMSVYAWISTTNLSSIHHFYCPTSTVLTSGWSYAQITCLDMLVYILGVICWVLDVHLIVISRRKIWHASDVTPITYVLFLFSLPPLSFSFYKIQLCLNLFYYFSSLYLY